MGENCRKSFNDTKVRCNVMAYHVTKKYNYVVSMVTFI